MSTAGPPTGGDEPPTEAEDEGKPDSWPKPDPDAEDIIWFMNDDAGDVAVRVSEGDVQKRGAPVHLFSQIVDLAGNAIADVGNLFVAPLVVSARAGASMTIVFGEGAADVDRPPLIDRQVHRSAEAISRLIAAENDDLFSAAFGVGKGAVAYAALVHFVETAGVRLDWKPRGQPLRHIDAERAARQYEQLTRPPEIRRRSLRIEGLLYRAIMDRPGSGTAGIKLTKESPVPPRHHGTSVVVRYEGLDIEQQILHHLLGQMIAATVQIVEIDPESRSIIRPELPHALVEQIEPTHRPVTLELFGDESA